MSRQPYIVPLGCEVDYYSFIDCDTPVKLGVSGVYLPTQDQPSRVEFKLIPGPAGDTAVPNNIQGITFEEFRELTGKSSGRRLVVQS